MSGSATPLNYGTRKGEPTMNLKRIGLGTAAYTVVTFPLAVVWHIGLFERQYRAFGYFEEEPSFALGLLTILIQGAVLSVLYPRVRLAGSDLARGLKFALILGVFFWTSHVLAFVAKQAVPHAHHFVLMETAYLTLQFGIFGILIGRIHRRQDELR